MIENLNEIIAKLPSNKQLLFGISCVYRMKTFLYKYFTNKELMCFLTRLIDEIFFNCTSEKFKSIGDTIGLEKEIEEYIPDTDEDGSCVVVLAQNAMIALAYCLNFIKEKKVIAIDYCSQKMIETVDVWALSVLQLDNSDLLISQEIANQIHILNMIKKMSCNISYNDLESYRNELEQYKMIWHNQ